ncbi:MAG: Asp-tRNA(Asn)/Glu-tRNA(Gln) amidotransferase subunit GatB [Amoebophilaceae bacterium]|nr:Asp-tRNA(Asn)/Glu-tRNA(Gln) amidotransferase subunit GatB [Amoebophilaceae bacterium]
MHNTIQEPYEAVIGLEIHIQLLTDSKMFSSDKAEYGALPNTNLSPITLACPGSLPQVNKIAFDHAIKLGLACESTITPLNYFARKSYFYPDLPKGFQITQDTTPICCGGFVMIYPKEGEEKKINLTRIHLEEDTGKSLHGIVDDVTLLDYNRAGIPLLELVTAPVIKSGADAYQFVAEIRKLVRYLEISDGNMEEGSLRCDVNISVMAQGSVILGTRVEVKNINSMRSVQLAVEYEIERQIALLEAGQPVLAETRNFQVVSGETIALRAKEIAGEYRYFPEPNIPPVYVSPAWIAEVQKTMPLLPRTFAQKFIAAYGLSYDVAAILTENKAFALFFDEVCIHMNHYGAAANWLLGPIKGYLNQMSLSLSELSVTAKQIAELTELVESGLVGFSIAASQILPVLLQEINASPRLLAERLNVLQERDEDKLQALVLAAVQAYPDKVVEYQNGKKGLLAMFMGEIMKNSQGRANAKRASQLLQEALEG